MLARVDRLPSFGTPWVRATRSIGAAIIFRGMPLVRLKEGNRHKHDTQGAIYFGGQRGMCTYGLNHVPLMQSISSRRMSLVRTFQSLHAPQ